MDKRIIFDVGHPAQIHQFKHLYWILERKGWICLFVTKKKDITIELLQGYSLNYKLLSKTGKNIFSKILQIPLNYFRFYKIVKRFKPDFILHRFSVHSAPIARLFRIVNIGFSDTEYASRLHKISLPFVDYKFTGKSYYNNLGENHYKYDGNIELFYLHPNHFVNNVNPYELLGIPLNKEYCIVRFVSWAAHHDVGIKPMDILQKINLINFLEKKYEVFISSENELPKELKKKEIHINPVYIHSVLKFATLYIGEGASMASEALCFGTPVIYTNPLPLAGSLKELYGLGILRHTWNISEIESIITNNEFYDKDLYNDYIGTKIDVTNFMIWFLENFPDSLSIIKENPDYQYRFR